MSQSDIRQVDQSEWQAQERGMDAARGAMTGEAETAAMEYRVIAEAVMSMPLSSPPMGFAAEVARRAQRLDARFERIVSRMLVSAFVAAVVIVGFCYGAQWWQLLHQSFHARTWQWVLVSVGCVALSWVCRRLIELAGNFSGGQSLRPKA